MKKKLTNLGFLIFSLWGVLIFSCGSSPSEEKDFEQDDEPKATGLDKNKTSSDKNKTSSGSQNDNKEKTREDAFLEVVKVLHSPYNKGDQFFKIFTGTDEITENKNGSEVSIGDDAGIAGKGTWAVKAGKDNEQGNNKEDSIVYTYTGFQPKGSKIIVDGTMKSMYRSKELGGGDKETIGFNKVGTVVGKNDKSKDEDEITKIKGLYNVKSVADASQGNGVVSITLGDILTITGEYQAKLEFIYPSTGIHSDVGAADYESKLVSDAGMFVVAGSTIEFTYNGKTEQLTKEQIKKLIKVA